MFLTVSLKNVKRKSGVEQFCEEKEFFRYLSTTYINI